MFIFSTKYKKSLKKLLNQNVADEVLKLTQKYSEEQAKAHQRIALKAFFSHVRKVTQLTSGQ